MLGLRGLCYVSLLLTCCLCCWSCGGTPRAKSTTQPAAATRPGYTFDLIPPSPRAVEVAPGLFVEAFFGAWDEGLREAKGEAERMRGKRPGWPFRSIGNRGGERFEFGMTTLFIAADQFNGAMVRYRETLTLPARPEGWTHPNDGDDDELPEPVRQKTSVSPDGRSFTTEQTVYMKPGQMIPSYQEGDAFVILSPFPTHAWGVADDDPLGRWKIEAYINDKLVLREEFDVVDGNAIHFAAPATAPAARD
jgi:hypothetical protein